MTFGENVTVPGDLLQPPGLSNQEEIQEEVKKFLPPPIIHSQRTMNISKSLTEQTHAFIRVDNVKPPLTPPYTDPYVILQRTPKAYKLDLGNKQDWISLDRLKPAYVDEDEYQINFSKYGCAHKRPS